MTKRGKKRGDYEVGRGKPPIHRQWAKGQSGNLNGRPKKVASGAHDTKNAGVGELILAEAGRTITSSGDNPISLPALEAVLKAMLANALKGNSLAQRSFVQFAVNAEAQRDKAKETELSAALNLKVILEDERLRWVAQGRDEMDMDRHPTDVQIDWQTGEVKLFLAFTEEERKARRPLLELRDHFQAVLKRSWATIAEDGDDGLLKAGREIAEHSIHKINEHLPPRFRESRVRAQIRPLAATPLSRSTVILLRRQRHARPVREPIAGVPTVMWTVNRFPEFCALLGWRAGT